MPTRFVTIPLAGFADADEQNSTALKAHSGIDVDDKIVAGRRDSRSYRPFPNPSESELMTAVGIRVGLGHDRHRLVPGRPLILGGVQLEFEMGLDGHSDADVLLHAVTDAILGAAGLGDIGEWFPNTDPQLSNADSAVFLTKAIEEVRRLGWEIGNLDCTIHAERPKLSPYKQTIQAQIAKLLNISENQVNVKAKTGEKVGPIGRQEAIDADAVVLLVQAKSG